MDATEHQCLNLARISTVVTGVLGLAAALLLATLDVASAQEAFTRIMSLVMGGFPALFMLALMTKRANSFGAFAAVFGSALTIYLVQKYTPVNWALYGAIAFVSALVIGYVVSILTGGSRKDLTGLTIWDSHPEKE